MLNLLMSVLASLETVSACNPTSTTCPSIPAMPSSVKYVLSTSNTADFSYIIPDRITQSGSSLSFAVAQQGDAPTLVTNNYLLYGNVKATIQSAPGTGMVSAFILMSDVLDEIDWEWLGADDTEVQSNYFYRGETANYDRGGKSAVTSPSKTTHIYEIDWTSDTLRWIIDGTTVRTLNKADTTAYGYPSTPCQIKVGVWASGDPTNEAGTISWGGGLIDYAAGPYNMTLQALSVTSYTTAKSFTYAAGGQTFSISQQGVAGSAASSGLSTSAQTAKTASTARTLASTRSSSSSSSPTTSTTFSGTATQARTTATGGIAVIAAAQVSGTITSTTRTSSATAGSTTASRSSTAASSSSSTTKTSSAGHKSTSSWLVAGIALLGLYTQW